MYNVVVYLQVKYFLCLLIFPFIRVQFGVVGGGNSQEESKGYLCPSTGLSEEIATKEVIHYLAHGGSQNMFTH